MISLNLVSHVLVAGIAIGMPLHRELAIGGLELAVGRGARRLRGFRSSRLWPCVSVPPVANSLVPRKERRLRIRSQRYPLHPRDRPAASVRMSGHQRPPQIMPTLFLSSSDLGKLHRRPRSRLSGAHRRRGHHPSRPSPPAPSPTPLLRLFVHCFAELHRGLHYVSVLALMSSTSSPSSLSSAQPSHSRGGARFADLGAVSATAFSVEWISASAWFSALTSCRRSCLLGMRLGFLDHLLDVGRRTPPEAWMRISAPCRWPCPWRTR